MFFFVFVFFFQTKYDYYRTIEGVNSTEKKKARMVSHRRIYLKPQICGYVEVREKTKAEKKEKEKHYNSVETLVHHHYHHHCHEIRLGMIMNEEIPS
jgi:hypothetical protein